MVIKNLNQYFDHTLLRADAQAEEIIRLLREAEEYQLASICILPYYLDLAYKMRQSTQLKLCTVVGFPLGASSPGIKKLETRKAIDSGADEIDMVINIGALKDKNWDYVLKEISEVVEEGKLTKVIIETAYLNQEEKIKAAQLSEQAGAHFVKTSTGFAHSGAQLEDIRVLRSILNPKTKLKASGGIRDLSSTEAFIEAGADRIGASASVGIMKAWSQK